MWGNGWEVTHSQVTLTNNTLALHAELLMCFYDSIVQFTMALLSCTLAFPGNEVQNASGLLKVSPRTFKITQVDVCIVPPPQR